MPKERLVALWDETEALLRDENCQLRALEAFGDVHGTVPFEAILEVFAAVPNAGQVSVGWNVREIGLLIIEDFDAAVDELKLDGADLLSEPHAFIYRHGVYKVPFPVAERLARLFCRRFPHEVLRYVKAEEEACRSAIVTGYYVCPREGSEYAVTRIKAEERLREQEPVFTLIRQWCRTQAEDDFNRVVALQAEVNRLRKIVDTTARWLRDAGHPVKASLLLKELNRDTGTSQRRTVGGEP